MLKKPMRIGAVRWPIGVALLLIGESVLSQHMNAKGAPCQNPGSTSDVTQCFADAQKAADKQLNETYSKIMGALEPDEKKSLVEAERLWVQFRDANCRAERSLYGRGSGAYTAFIACVEAMTRQRTNDLLVSYEWRIAK